MRKFVSSMLLLSLAIPCRAETPPVNPLPVRSVTLFTSGVGYVERGGEVEGDATLPLTFRTAQINDILKSMIMLDSNGRVQPATYASRDPIYRTLQSFAVDVTQYSSQAEILNRLRGQRVTIDTGKATITGQIVGVETRQVAGEDAKPITVAFLNVLTESGLMSIRLDGEKTIRFLDERINREFREALTLLASGSDDQRRQVAVHFSGNGKRQVRVGYVTEAPLWKMSYRLMIGGKEQGKPAALPYLQGWALVENTSDDDWKDVRLSLVSGRPVSFIQDLYQPLYLPRPVVAPDVIASAYPQTHGGNMDADRQQLAEAGAQRPPGTIDAFSAQTSGVPQMRAGAVLGQRLEKGRVADVDKDGRFKPLSGAGGGGGKPGNSPALLGDLPLVGNMFTDSAAIIRSSVQSQSSGANAGELFQYNISTPVNLPRQQAAMIPVVAQDIGGDKVLLFNADTGPKFPLNAVRIKNTTSLHLKGGPVTIFDEGVYAGDAKMEDIPPGDDRLVSYAVDLTVEGERQGPGSSILDTALSLKRGVLTVTRRETIETTYKLKSKAEKPRNVLVEYPFNAEYKLVQPAKPLERNAEVYRFSMAIAPGKIETLKVVTERPISQTVTILDCDLNALAYYANKKDISEKLKETLQEVVQRRRKVQEIQAQAANLDNEIKAIDQDQERIRKNMGALDKLSALYKRYVGELDAQETRIQNLRKDAARLRSDAAVADRELRALVDGITIAG